MTLKYEPEFTQQPSEYREDIRRHITSKRGAASGLVLVFLCDLSLVGWIPFCF